MIILLIFTNVQNNKLNHYIIQTSAESDFVSNIYNLGKFHTSWLLTFAFPLFAFTVELFLFSALGCLINNNNNKRFSSKSGIFNYSFVSDLPWNETTHPWSFLFDQFSSIILLLFTPRSSWIFSELYIRVLY